MLLTASRLHTIEKGWPYFEKYALFPGMLPTCFWGGGAGGGNTASEIETTGFGEKRAGAEESASAGEAAY